MYVRVLVCVYAHAGGRAASYARVCLHYVRVRVVLSSACGSASMVHLAVASCHAVSPSFDAHFVHCLTSKLLDLCDLSAQI